MTIHPEPTADAPEHLAVFLDFMNAYEGAMQAVGADRSNPGTEGQFDPWSVAMLIAARRKERRGRPQQLVMVRVYRGMPSPTRDKQGASRADRQVARWNRDAAKLKAPLKIRRRPLAYDNNGKPHEKGIDTMLAVELALGAACGQFDAAVVFSGDADLLPGIEAAASLGVACESASWVGGGRRMPQQSVAYTYLLSLEDYRRVSDRTDYRQKLRPR